MHGPGAPGEQLCGQCLQVVTSPCGEAERGAPVSVEPGERRADA